MPLGAMAQVRPCFFSVPQSAGSTSSTDRQPSSLATWQVVSTSHFSPAVLKHQKTIDCLIRPRLTAFRRSATAGTPDEGGGRGAVQQSAAGELRRDRSWLFLRGRGVVRLFAAVDPPHRNDGGRLPRRADRLTEPIW